MSEDLYQKAMRLAERPYTDKFEQEALSDGTLGFFGYTVELDGCMAQGDTLEETKESLFLARVDCIEYMLEEGLPIPEPLTQASSYTDSSVGTIQVVSIPTTTYVGIPSVRVGSFQVSATGC